MHINHDIRCNVDCCKFNDNSTSSCNLDNIKIGTTSFTASSSKDTQCASFEPK